jgi:XTP/dITP diphosphohydrolase
MLPSMVALLIATRNSHKVGEIRAILGDAFQFLTLNDFPQAPQVIEDAPTFDGNATKKAVELAKWIAVKYSTSNSDKSRAGVQHPTPNFVLADDSGLEVDALDGAPGVHSARFAALGRGADGSSAGSAGNSSDADNNARLLRLLQDVPPGKRKARFRCVIALVPVPEPQPAGSSPVCYAGESEAQIFDGACEGRIGLAPRGKNGFGYDPLFTPVGFDKTFAELGEGVKNQLSHRAKALEKLKAYFSVK